jgi:hypothetical protein
MSQKPGSGSPFAHMRALILWLLPGPAVSSASIFTVYHLFAVGAPIEGMPPAGKLQPPAHFWYTKYPGDGALSMETSMERERPFTPSRPLLLIMTAASEPA